MNDIVDEEWALSEAWKNSTQTSQETFFPIMYDSLGFDPDGDNLQGHPLRWFHDMFTNDSYSRTLLDNVILFLMRLNGKLMKIRNPDNVHSDGWFDFLTKLRYLKRFLEGIPNN